jgi:peptide/nickel transport system substrate-binding protein
MGTPVADFINPLAGRYTTIFPHELVDDGTIRQKAVGTGPMILKEMVPASHIAYEKNPSYFRRQVLLDGAEHRIMPDAASRLAAFRAGQVDTGYTIVGTLSDVRALLKTNPDVQVQMTPVTTGGMTFAMNLELPKFQDERVRQAISMAIDRPSVIQIVYEGLGKSLHVFPWEYVFDEEPGPAELGPYMQYNPTEAKRLLTAAGSENLEINSKAFAYGTYVTKTAEMLTDLLRAVGIKLNNQLVDYTQFNSQWTGAKLEEASTSGWAGSGYDADNWFYNQVKSGSIGNRWRLNDPQMDQWAEAQRVELDPAERREILRKMWDHDLKKMYRPTLTSGITPQAFPPWVRFLRSGNGSAISYDDGAMIESIWLDK